MAADGTVTGTGTKWQSSLSLIRPGATIMFLSSPIQMAVVNKVVSDTEIKAITTNGAVVASSDYAILLSDSLTVDGLAQDVAETLRYYQSQETVIADAVEFFKDFDFESLQNIANQIKSYSEAAESSATAAAVSENAAKTSEDNSKASEDNSKASAVAAETARDQVQQIINDAGEKSTLVVLAQPTGAEKSGTSGGITVQQYIDAVPHISILEYIDPGKWQYLNNPTTAEANIGDLHYAIMQAQKDAAFSGKPLVFCGPPAKYLEGVTSSQNFFFPTSPVEWVEGAAILATGHGKCRLIPVAGTPDNTFIFTIPPANGKPRIAINGLGFTGGNYRDKNVGGFTLKRGCYTSHIENIFIQDCYYGGFVIKPENPAGKTTAEDIVNLNIDNIMIVNSGSQSAYQAFDVQFSTEWGSGNWTDGAVRNIDISTAFADNTTIDTAPISLNIYNVGKQIFNVLFERWYTSAKAATHLKVYSNSDIRNTNLSFRNFSGDGIVKTSEPMIDINGLGWSHLEDVYRGSLINGGLRVATTQNVTFSNMVFGASTDAEGNYVPQLQVLSTAVDTKFQNCAIRNPFGTSAPYNYRKWFTDWIIDSGVNTQWDGPQFKSDVIVMRSFDYFNTVLSGKCTNAVSQNAGITAVQDADYLQLSYPAQSGAASPSISFSIPANLRKGPAGDDYVYVMIRVSCTSATIGGHRLSVDMYDTSFTWQPDVLNSDVYLLFKFPVNADATNKNIKLTMGSTAATTDAFTLQFKEIAITSGPLPWAPNYRKTLQVI